MRKVLMTLMLLAFLVTPVQALELEAPQVPAAAARFMPESPENLGQALLEMIRDALLYLSPDLRQAAGSCLGILAVVMVVSVVHTLPGAPKRAADLSGTAAIGLLVLQSANSLINLAAGTVAEISEYGKLLLPVMTTAMAAEGAVTSSAALYAGTAVFDSILSSLIVNLIIPLVYFFLAMAATAAATGEEMISKLKDMLKGVISWALKTVLYVFTGYITVTGVVSGTTDAAALKAAKLTISGAVPVVGGILSEASEAVLVTAGTVKNAVGVYGMLATLAIWLGPFLEIGSCYLMLKGTGLVCGIFGSKVHSGFVQDLSTALGLLLAMTGSVCLMLLISMVCFLKGAA